MQMLGCIERAVRLCRLPQDRAPSRSWPKESLPNGQFRRSEESAPRNLCFVPRLHAGALWLCTLPRRALCGILRSLFKAGRLLGSISPWRRLPRVGQRHRRRLRTSVVRSCGCKKYQKRVATTPKENPCEALKTQKQLWGSYDLRSGFWWRGFSATCLRNMVLVSLFFGLSEKLNLRDVSWREQPFLRGSCVSVCCA